MAKRKDLMKMSFNPPMDCLLDWWLWVQMAYLGKFYYIPELLTGWRLHTDSYIYKSKHNSPKQLQIKIYIAMSKKYKDPFILIFIAGAQFIWYLQQIKKRVKGLISKKWGASFN